MKRLLVTFITTLLVMLMLDIAWIGFIAAELYANGIGHLMAKEPNLYAAVIFYIIFISGLMVFAITPRNSVKISMRQAALYGFFTYSTYEFTNMATLINWPVGMTVIDIAWGISISTVSAFVGKKIWNAFE